TQHPNWLQRVIASILGLPLAKVRILSPDPGGAFGGKQHAKYEPLLAYMALRAGRPVRLVLSLEETFQAVRRGASRVHVRSGFREDGRLAFREVDADYLIGAYADIADRTVAKGSYTSAGPYAIPAVRLKSGPTPGLSHATVRLLADGSVVVYSGTSDMGQGARTIFAQIAAHELGAPLEWVTVVMGDTAVVPYDQQTSASRSSVIMGNAVLAACRDVQAKIRAMA